MTRPAPAIRKVGSDLILSGTVGSKAGFCAADLVSELGRAAAGRRPSLRLTSTGGSVIEGLAAAAAVQNHPDGVTVTIEGIAASAASVIACAAARTTISPGSIMMIHKVSEEATDKAAHERRRTMNESMAAIYAKKTGRSPAEMLKLMSVETWLTAEEALQQGFVDAIEGQSAPAPKPSPEDLSRDPAVIAEMCAAAEQPTMAAPLIRDGVTVVEARSRLDVAGSIRAAVAAAYKMSPHAIDRTYADRAILARAPLKHVQAALIDAMAAVDESMPVDNTKPTGDGTLHGRAASKADMKRQVAADQAKRQEVKP